MKNFPMVFEKVPVNEKSQQQKIQGYLLGFSTFYPHLKSDTGTLSDNQPGIFPINSLASSTNRKPSS